jgi:hypothetical protein
VISLGVISLGVKSPSTSYGLDTSNGLERSVLRESISGVELVLLVLLDFALKT